MAAHPSRRLLDRLGPRLFEVGTWATATLDPDEVLRRAAAGLRRALEAESVVAYAYHAHDRSLQMRASAGSVRGFRSHARARRNGFTLRAVRSRSVVMVPDCQKDPTLSPDVLAAGIRSFACLPLAVDADVRGLVYVNFASPREYPEDLTNILSALAGQVAVAVDRAEAYQQLRSMHDRMIISLAEAVDARDHPTAGHSRRLRAYARAVGRRLGVEAEELHTLETAALLHDIGKIGIRDEVLLKPFKLSAAERREVEQHSIVGARILAAAGMPQAVVEAVRHNHERYDGKGYPAGLAGERIPRAARILAVVDAFEAMTSDRPYQPGMSWAQAAEELRRHRGTQFDPVVVDAFLSLLQSEDADRLAKEVSDVSGPTPDPTLALHPVEASSRLAGAFYAFTWGFIERFERTVGPWVAEELVESLPIIPVFERPPVPDSEGAASDGSVRRKVEDYRNQVARMIAYAQRVCGERICENLLEETFASLPQDLAQACWFLVGRVRDVAAQR
ncbi:MAG: HD domain-containing protein [Armatimonadota bacterium]|nr:HD domain-containing protein [Armatimonadota bacterium]